MTESPISFETGIGSPVIIDSSTLLLPDTISPSTGTFSPGTSPKVNSISRRFSYALISIIALLLIVFTTIVTLYDISRIESEMQKRLDNAILFAENSLPTPLWNLDYMVVNDFVEALFLDESIVYLRIWWKDQIITVRERPGIHLKHIDSAMLPAMLKDSELIAKSSDIYFKEKIISKILIVMSREKVKKQALYQIYGTVALLILMIAAIWLTSIFVTRRYITTPLKKLQASASLIAQGDLGTFVDKSSSDEIGMLAQHLDHAAQEAEPRLLPDLFADTVGSQFCRRDVLTPEEGRQELLCFHVVLEQGEQKTRDGDLPDVPVNVIEIAPLNTGEALFAGTDSGLYVSFDKGQHWGRYGSGLPNATVIDVRVDLPRTRIVVATQGRGVWRAPLMRPAHIK